MGGFSHPASILDALISNLAIFKQDSILGHLDSILDAASRFDFRWVFRTIKIRFSMPPPRFDFRPQNDHLNPEMGWVTSNLPRFDFSRQLDPGCHLDSILAAPDLLKYLQNRKKWFHGQKRKKIYSPTHPFLMIKNCIHVTHKMHPPLALFWLKSSLISVFTSSIIWNQWFQIPREETASKV